MAGSGLIENYYRPECYTVTFCLASAVCRTAAGGVARQKRPPGVHAAGRAGEEGSALLAAMRAQHAVAAGGAGLVDGYAEYRRQHGGGEDVAGVAGGQQPAVLQ